MSTETPEDALVLAVKAIGGLTATGEKFDITPQAVGQWGRAPIGRVLRLEELSGISRHRLRPDIFGPAVEAALAPQPAEAAA